ncbi:MAG: hypothetical protein L3J69_02490 [Desulfobacula sp.]|nr:hypothetical protein [Desulfobacula sp.]
MSNKKHNLMSGVNLVRKLLFLFFIILFGHFKSGYAFYQTYENTEELRIEHTTKEAATQDNIGYHLYDNLVSKTSSFFLSKKIDKFISFDQIEINIPLRFLSKNLITAEDSMDRMLTSNLRIRQILFEYQKIKNRAESLLRNRDVIHAETKNKKPLKSSETTANSIEDQITKLENIIININRSGLVPSGGFDTDGILSFDFNASLGQNVSDAQYRNFYPLSSQGGQKQFNTIESEFRVESRTLSNQDAGQLPWIFDVFLKLINYMMSNRVEIMLYAMFLVLIGLLVSLKVRK